MNARVPRTRVQSAGRISSTLELLAETYRKENPQMEPRWVYDPIHKPELSGITQRLATGYQIVTWSQLGETMIPRGNNVKDDDPVRVADSVLMGVPADIKRELERENADRHAEQLRSIDRNYYQAINDLETADPRHKPRPRGTSVIEEREFEFDYVQKEGGE